MFVLHSVHLVLYDTIALSVERYYMRKRPSKQTSVLPLLSFIVYSLRERKLAVNCPSFATGQHILLGEESL